MKASVRLWGDQFGLPPAGRARRCRDSRGSIASRSWRWIAPAQDRMRLAEGDAAAEEAPEIGVFRTRRQSIQPARCPGNRRCCPVLRAILSPIRIMGTPPDRPSAGRWRCACRPRRARMAGSSVGPSAPQFQLLLSLVLPRLSSPLARLRFRNRTPKSLRVKPSWQVTKLIDAVGPRSRYMWASL